MTRTSLLLVSIFISVASQAQENNSIALRELTDETYSYYLNKPDTAILLAERALARALETKDVFYEGYCYFLLCKTYWVKANYKLSTEYGFKALRLFRDTPHERELSQTLLALGRDLVELGNTSKAREFIREALNAGIRNSDEWIQAMAYREQSYLHAELNQLDSALYCADKGLALFGKVNDSLEVSVLYGRKSRIYFQQKMYAESKKHAYHALLIDSLVGNRRGLGIAYYQVAQNEHVQGNISKAVKYLNQSLRINTEIGNLTWMIRAHEFLASLHLQNDRPALAAAELRKASELKDDLYNSEKNGQIQEMQSLLELESKENKINLLEQEFALKHQQVKNQRLIVAFLLVAVLFLFLLSFVLARLRKVQSRANRHLADQNIAIEQQKVAIQVQADNLQQVDQMKTKLFSVISHDLRGPIANLQSLLELFTKKLMTAEEFLNLSGKLKENLNITQRTLENLLNWSLSQMGGIKTEKKKIDVGCCIDEACGLMNEVAARKNITLVAEMEMPLKVWADEDQLQVVLRNLIHNAIKFSSFNDRIEIKATNEKGYCNIAIKDSGIGMTHQEIETIVGSKNYFSKTGTEQEKGTGLGLLLCKEFIIRNGGEIRIKSSVGEGTEVSFCLMLAEREKDHQPAIQQ